MQNYPYYITDTLTKYYQRFQVTTYAPLKAPLIYGQKILGGNAVYFRFQELDSRPPVRGIWIPNSEFQSFEGFWTPRPRIPDSGIRITFRGAIQSKEHRTLNIQTEYTQIRDFSPKRYSSEYLKYLHDVLLYGKKRVTAVECDESQTKSIIKKLLFSKLLRNYHIGTSAPRTVQSNISFSQIDLDNSGFELSRSYVYVIQTQLSGHVYVKLLTQVNYILRRLQSKSDFIRYEFHIQGYLQCKRNEKKNEDGRYNFSTYLSNFLLRTSLRRPQCLSMISIAFPVESIFSCEQVLRSSSTKKYSPVQRQEDNQLDFPA